MTTRREKVILEFVDRFSGGAGKAAATTALLNKELDGLSKQGTVASRRFTSMSKGADKFGASLAGMNGEIDRTNAGLGGLTNGGTFTRVSRDSDRASGSINQLTGRLRLLADVALILGPSLAPIGAVAVPALTGLASQAGFATVALGSLVVAAQGVGDALEAVNDAAMEPTAANLEKAEQAMAKLGPEAQAFVTRFQQLRPVLGDIRDAAAAGWFPGITEALDSLESAAPRIESLFNAIGEAGGNLIAEGAESLAGPEWAEFIAFVEDNAPQALDELGRTVGNLTKGLANMWMAFDPLNDDFSAWLLEQSRAFSEWSDGLAENQGFQEFVDYIRTNGPRVADALSAVGDAVVEIIEAISPLGGPSLKIIETFANAIGNIADSDLGTPILAGVTALVAYNRMLRITIALQKQMGITSAAATSGGLFAGGKGGGKAGLLKRGAGPAALLAGITLASTDMGDSLLQTNKASLALLGTMGGPFGAAAGLAAGALLDMAAANDKVMASIASGNLEQAAKDLKAFKQEVDDDLDPSKKGFVEAFISGLPGGQLLTDGGGIKNKLEGFLGQSDVEEAEAALDFAQTLSGSVDMLKNYADAKKQSALASSEATAADYGLTSATWELGNAMGLTNAEIAAGIAAIDARTSAALGAFDADTQWRNALNAATEAAKANNAGIRGNSEAALTNRARLSDLAKAWGNQRDTMDENGATLDELQAKYKVQRRSFIDTAIAMGVPRKAAIELANKLLAIPEKKAITLTAQDKASAKIANAVNLLGGFKSKTITITTLRDDFGAADGDTVPDDGGGYRDYLTYKLAPREEVISNRRKQADNFRPELKDINSGMSRTLVARRMLSRGLADGGTVATSSRSISAPVSVSPSLSRAAAPIDYARLAVSVASALQARPPKAIVERQVARDIVNVGQTVNRERS